KVFGNWTDYAGATRAATAFSFRFDKTGGRKTFLQEIRNRLTASGRRLSEAIRPGSRQRRMSAPTNNQRRRIPLTAGTPPGVRFFLRGGCGIFAQPLANCRNPSRVFATNQGRVASD